METDDLDWIALDSAKPGRDRGQQCWVAQANAAFSRRHLELEPPQIAERMLPLLCRHIGRRPAEATHAVAHRWRFSQAERPLGQPFLADSSQGLLLGGDWCLGRTVEDAWTSGRALAAQLLGA
jgi:predicted NAD/FAD-dependent oxidoreductase